MIRALVLGGGGLAGIAWEVGVLVGLAKGGVDVGAADRIIGTSAGSVVGTLLATGVDLATVHAEHRDAARPAAGPAVELDMAAMGAAFAEAMDGARDEWAMRARMGAFARGADTVPEWDRRAVIGARLPVQSWPGRDLRATAVDTASGETVVFTGRSGVELVDAVAASCAVPGVWPPVTIGDRRYMDGGMASIVHVNQADVPTPADVVLVVAPLDPPPGGPFPSVTDEVCRRRAAAPGNEIVAALADEASQRAFGANVLDPASMPGSAETGRVQGRTAAAEVGAAWGRA